MNTLKLARSTFVIDRITHDELEFLAPRLGVSRSGLVRDLLAEPVSLLARWVRSVPSNATALDLRLAAAGAQDELFKFIEARGQFADEESIP